MESALPATGDGTRRVFRSLNRWFMIPVHRAGLGAWIATPVGGWMLLMRVRGRKSGAIHEVPVSYVIAEGAAWVAAGFGPRTQWLRNLEADPAVEVVLPGRAPLPCRATVETDEAVRRRILPALLRATGAPALFAGANPWTSDADTLVALAPMPLVRLAPADGPLVPGADDPGGAGWVWRQALVLLATLGGLRLLLSLRKDGR